MYWHKFSKQASYCSQVQNLFWKPFHTFCSSNGIVPSFFRAHFQSLRDILSLRKRTVTWLLAMSKQAWHSRTCLQNQHPHHLPSLWKLFQPTYSDQVRCWKFRSGWLHRWPGNRNAQQRMFWRSHISQIGLKRVSTTGLSQSCFIQIVILQ